MKKAILEGLNEIAENKATEWLVAGFDVEGFSSPTGGT